MVMHITHVFDDLARLEGSLTTGVISEAAAESKSILVQVFCAESDHAQIEAISSVVMLKIPIAKVVGASSVGEIANGELFTNRTVLGFTLFASTEIILVAQPCEYGSENTIGADLGRKINLCDEHIVGVLLLATPLSIDAAALLTGLESTANGYQVFGGGAGYYNDMSSSWVICGHEKYQKGVVAVVLCGDDLTIESRTYLGWKPLSKSMRVTEMDGLLVKRVDHKPAFEVYQHYLNLSKDDDFFLNALEFPFLLERDGELLARGPVGVTEDGYLQFVADIKVGESFRIGYGDLDLIVDDAREIHQSMAAFSPEAIYLYSCGTRRFLMQDDVALETLPFEKLAPTFGFYTYGEFFGTKHMSLLNSTMVAVALREGPKSVVSSTPSLQIDSGGRPLRDPYAHKHVRVVSRLMRFIEAVTTELESANRELTKASTTDHLTQLSNRIHLDRILSQSLDLSIRHSLSFSVILLDIDHFKRVNDTYGHIVGDAVLVQVAQILSNNTRSTDTVGRWGGEEFLIVAPNSDAGKTIELAEKLRIALSAAEFPQVGHVTGSWGVACYEVGDDVGGLLGRADLALYEAKDAGRNCVKFGGA